MRAQDDSQDRTDAALRDFRAQVEGLGLWNEVWLGVVGIKSSTSWVCFLFRAILIAPGVRLPSNTELFDATTQDVRIRVSRVALGELWALMRELTQGSISRLSSIFEAPISLPAGRNPPLFQFSRSSQRDRLHMLLMRNANVPFHELFGFELFDRLGPQLRAHRPPYGGTKELAENVHPVWGASFEQNNSSPIFEVSAEIPIAPVRAFFNAAHGGIEVRTSVGSAVPLDRVSVSVTPSPRCGLRGDDFERTRAGESFELFRLVASPEPEVEVAVHLQFDDLAISVDRIHASARNLPVLVGYSAVPPPEEWIRDLEREFHVSLASLRRRLRAVLIRRVADVAEERIAESIRLRERSPFLSVVSAASVAEVLLKERIRKVGPGVRRAAWSRLRASDSKLPKKVQPDLKFDHAIRLATELGLLGDIDSQSMDLLRIARNELHIDRLSEPSHEDFSPVRAAAAILATLNLGCSIQKKARSARRVAPSLASQPPSP